MLSWALRNKRGMAVSAEVLACLAGIQREAHRAARLFGVAPALQDAANYILPPTLAELHERGEMAARAELGDDLFVAAREEGRRLPLPEGVALALGGPGVLLETPAGIAHASRPALTRRQVEILQLIAKGLTDRQVGVPHRGSVPGRSTALA